MAVRIKTACAGAASGGSVELVTVQVDCLQTSAPCLLALKPTTTC